MSEPDTAIDVSGGANRPRLVAPVTDPQHGGAALVRKGCGCDLAWYYPQCVSWAAESSAQAQPGPSAQEDNGRENYYIGECGHRVPAEPGSSGLLFRVGPCRECDEESCE